MFHYLTEGFFLLDSLKWRFANNDTAVFVWKGHVRKGSEATALIAFYFLFQGRSFKNARRVLLQSCDVFTFFRPQLFHSPLISRISSPHFACFATAMMMNPEALLWHCGCQINRKIKTGYAFFVLLLFMWDFEDEITEAWDTFVISDVRCTERIRRHVFKRSIANWQTVRHLMDYAASMMLTAL